MKRLLLGTSALVAAGVLMSGPAAAAGLEASLNGYMEQWFGFRSLDNDDTLPGAPGGADINDFTVKSDTEVHFNARVTLDNGLQVLYNVQLEGNTSGDQIDESYLQLTGSFGQFLIGSENSATYKMGFGPKDFGIGTLSGDDVGYINTGILGAGPGHARNPWNSVNVEVDISCNDDKRLTYFSPRFSGFQFGISYTPNCGTQDASAPLTTENDNSIHDVVSIGANYTGKFDQVSVGLSGGFHHGTKPTGNTDNDPNVIVFGAKFGFGGFSLGGYFADTLDTINSPGPIAAGSVSSNNKGYAAGLAYETGPWPCRLEDWRANGEPGV